MDLAQLLGIVVAAAGGTTVVVAGLAAWVGKVWADRIAQQHKLASDTALQEQKLLADRLLQDQKNTADRMLQDQKTAADRMLQEQKSAIDRMLQDQKAAADRLLQAQKFGGEVDADLRKRRIEVYTPLWKSTALLPQWPRATHVTYAQLQELSASFRTWYYETGGMYLSRSTRKDAYSPLQDLLKELAQSGKTGVLSDEDYSATREKCSALRSALAADIESRREAPSIEP